METIYECILGSTIHFAQTQQDTGKYRNALHRFVINGGGAK